MLITSPIFIGGINRSGTSLMRQLIGSHSQVAIPPTEFEFFKKIRDIHKSLNRHEFSDKVQEILDWGKVREWELNEQEVQLAAAIAEPSYKALFLLFLDQYRLKLTKNRVGEKTTHNEIHLAELDEWFGEDYQFIHMIRNPVDALASTLYASGSRRTINSQRWCLQWLRSVQVGITRSISHPEQYRMVRYEDIILDSDTVIKNLCGFLNVEFERNRMFSMTDFIRKDNTSFDIKAEGSVYQGMIRISDDVDRTSMLSTENLASITSICGSLAELFGYKLEGDSRTQMRHATALLDEIPADEAISFLGMYAVRRTYKALRRRLPG